jgi:hypothetical protein
MQCRSASSHRWHVQRLKHIRYTRTRNAEVQACRNGISNVLNAYGRYTRTRTRANLHTTRTLLAMFVTVVACSVSTRFRPGLILHKPHVQYSKRICHTRTRTRTSSYTPRTLPTNTFVATFATFVTFVTFATQSVSVQIPMPLSNHNIASKTRTPRTHSNTYALEHARTSTPTTRMFTDHRVCGHVRHVRCV